MCQSFLHLRSGLTVRCTEAGPATGRPLICLPGWCCSVFTFHEVLPLLGRAGYRAIAVDPKGHGLSDKPVARYEYATAAMVDHLFDIFDALGYQAPPVLGYSLGGALALYAALERPDRLPTIVLVNPVGLSRAMHLAYGRWLTPPWALPLAQHFVPRAIVTRLLHVAFGDIVRPTAEDVDEYWAPTQFPGFAAAMHHLLHDFDWAPLPEDRLRQLRSCVLLLIGARDRVIDGAEALRRLSVLPGVRAVAIPGAGHVLPEEAPQALVEQVLAFLRDVNG